VPRNVLKCVELSRPFQTLETRCSDREIIFARNFFKKLAPEGCIPESFVGNYSVADEPGAHFLAMTPRSLQARAPSWGGLRQSATLKWLRFFIAVRILSPDSACFRLFFWPDLDSLLFWDWRGLLTRLTNTFRAPSPSSSATSTTSATTDLTAATVIPPSKLPPSRAFPLRKPA